MSPARAPSIRAYVVAIVLAGAILPLAIVGVWLSSSAVRSGETLLREHLRSAAGRFVESANASWQYRNADLQFLAHNEVTARVVRDLPLTAADSQFLLQLFTQVSGWIPALHLADSAGVARWTSPAPLRGSGRGVGRAPRDPVIEMQVPAVTDAGVPVGMVLASVRLGALIPPDSGRPLVEGARVALRRLPSMRLLISLDTSLPFPTAKAVTLGGKPWLVERGTVAGSGLEVAVAAPLASYVTPFERAGRISLIALAIVTGIALLLTTFLATRLTRPVGQLADAAGAVVRGDLDQRVTASGPQELRRLGTSFNAMTESLRSTLHELSRRSALAAVGEFATSLSHDVRNALTSIKVDLQRAGRRSAADATGKELVERALHSITRLDTAVSAALSVARGTQVAHETVDVRDVVRSAAEAVLGAYSAVPATLELELPGEPQLVDGDRVALEQLFANLLFNAGQAVRPGGSVRVNLTGPERGVVVIVADDGVGMTAAQLDGAPGATSSSRRNGTGLGLPIARRIAAAHGGELSISSEPGAGTRVRVELPRLPGE